MYIIGVLFLMFIIIFEMVIWRKRRSYDGVIVITRDRTGKKLFSLELDKTPEEIEKMKSISFKVVPMDEDDVAIFQIQPKDFAE
jgi:hypothetical protein